MNKLFICLIAFSAIIILLFPQTAIASKSDIEVIINGKKLNMDVPPIIENGRTLVPFRALFEALGVNVEWNSADKNIIASTKTKKGNLVKYISLKIGEKSAIISDSGKYVTLEVPPIIKDDRTMVPLRFVSEALDMEVDWDGSTKTVNVSNKEFMLSDGGFIVKTQGSSSIKSDIEFLEFKDYAEDCKYILALGEDNKLYIVSKSDLKNRLISNAEINNLDSYDLTYYNGKFYYVDSSIVDKSNRILKVTNGEKETEFSSISDYMSNMNKIGNRLYFVNQLKYQGICGFKYIDMDTDKEFTIANSEYVQLLYGSDDAVLYIHYIQQGTDNYQADFHLRIPDKENLDEDKIILTLYTNKTPLRYSIKKSTDEDSYYQSNSVIAESNYIIYDLGFGVYSFNPIKKELLKLSDLKPRSMYYSNNKVYLIDNSEIGYIELNNNKYTKLFNKPTLFEDNNFIKEVDEDGNIIFYVYIDLGREHRDTYEYKYLIQDNKLELCNYTPDFFGDCIPKMPVGTTIDVYN